MGQGPEWKCSQRVVPWTWGHFNLTFLLNPLRLLLHQQGKKLKKKKLYLSLLQWIRNFFDCIKGNTCLLHVIQHGCIGNLKIHTYACAHTQTHTAKSREQKNPSSGIIHSDICICVLFILFYFILTKHILWSSNRSWFQNMENIPPACLPWLYYSFLA